MFVGIRRGNQATFRRTTSQSSTTRGEGGDETISLREWLGGSEVLGGSFF